MQSDSRYRLAIFDFDGTLADSFPWFARAVNDFADEFRFKRLDPAEHDLVRGFDTRGVLRHLGVPLWKLPAIANKMRQRVAEDWKEINLFPGVSGMLAELGQADLTVAIVSSNAETNIRRILGETNAAQIESYACGASLFGKAAKLKTVLRRSGISAAEAIYIGDEIRDAQAARDLRMDFGAVSWGYTKAEALLGQQPALCFREVGEIPRILGNLPH